MNAPLDGLHAECVAERDGIRAAFAALRAKVMAWEPSPMPVTPAKQTPYLDQINRPRPWLR